MKELNRAIDGGTEGLLRLGEDARGREFYTTVEMQKLEAGNLELIRELRPFSSVTGVEECGVISKGSRKSRASGSRPDR